MTDLIVRHATGTVGLITRTAGVANFTYGEQWRSDPNATPLSLSMPIATRSHPNDIIEHFVWNLLPDNDRVLERWGRQFNVTTSHPFGLIEHVGDDLPGAMQIASADDGASPSSKRRRTEWLTETDLAALLAEVHRDNTAWIGPDEPGHWSLAGAQPKIALLHDPKRGWGRPKGSTPTTHIIKPAVAGLDDHDLNEHLCLTAARSLGLPAAHTSVQAFSDQRAIVVTRYDRHNGQRIHQEDLCQALGIHPAAKYQNENGPSPADIAAMFRHTMQFQAAYNAANRFADGLIYNWVIGGTDAHAKNYSVLLDGRDALLAPLYDIASALPYDDIHFPKAKLAMKIGKHYKIAAINAKSWQQLADDLSIAADDLIERARQLALAVPDAIHAAATDPLVAELGSPLPALLASRIEAHASDCLRRLR